jgi:hypothetical protein
MLLLPAAGIFFNSLLCVHAYVWMIKITTKSIEIAGEGWCDPNISDSFIQFCNEQLRPALSHRCASVRNNRKISNIKLSPALRSKCLAALANESGLAELLASVLGSPGLLAIQSIVAPPRSGAQELHRDTDRGSGCLQTLVVSCNGQPLRTRLQPRSHCEEHRIIYRSAERLADLALREASVIVPGRKALLYDGAIYHGGGANLSDDPDDARLFFVFVDINKDAELLREIADANYISSSTKLSQLRPAISSSKLSAHEGENPKSTQVISASNSERGPRKRTKSSK